MAAAEVERFREIRVLFGGCVFIYYNEKFFVFHGKQIIHVGKNIKKKRNLSTFFPGFYNVCIFNTHDASPRVINTIRGVYTYVWRGEARRRTKNSAFIARV